MSKIITIGRQYGSGGRAVGRIIAEKLGIPLYDKELVELAFIASDFMMDKDKAPVYFRKLSELEGSTLSDTEYYDYLNEITDLQRTYGKYL